jgi:hypothetical protein
MLEQTSFDGYFGPIFQLYCLLEIVPVSQCLWDALTSLLQGYGSSLWPGSHGSAKSFCTAINTVHFSFANFVTRYLLMLDLAQK